MSEWFKQWWTVRIVGVRCSSFPAFQQCLCHPNQWSGCWVIHVFRLYGTVDLCYDRFSSPVGTKNRDGSEVGGILTTAHQEFGGCAHRCAGKPKCREQDRASLSRRGRAQSGTAEGWLSELGDFCRVQARHWTPSCVRYMSWALSKARGCRWEHQGRA